MCGVTGDVAIRGSVEDCLLGKAEEGSGGEAVEGMAKR